MAEDLFIFRLVQRLRRHHYGVTVVPAQAGNGPAGIILISTTRAKAGHLADAIRRFDPGLFFTIEDVRSVEAGIFARKAA